jgi:Rap1a immunity proteins
MPTTLADIYSLMRRTLLGCLAAGIVFAAWITPGPCAETGYVFYQTCLKGDRGNSFEGVACIRYIQGLWDGLVLAGYSFICPHEPIQLGQLELIFVKWARDNPERLGMEAQFVLATAFTNAFPCPKR